MCPLYTRGLGRDVPIYTTRVYMPVYTTRVYYTLYIPGYTSWYTPPPCTTGYTATRVLGPEGRSPGLNSEINSEKEASLRL